MNFWAAIKDPLLGKTSLSRVFWLYGVVGSILCSMLGLLFDSGNVFAMRTYSVLGLLFSIYVTVATYQCASNCRSPALARFVRVSAVISLIVLPVFAYLDFSGARDAAVTTLMSGEQ